jgi:hypothetical protein
MTINLKDLWAALFARAKVNGDDQKRAAEKMLAATNTPGRTMRLRGLYYTIFLDERGELSGAEELWAATLDESLRDAALRISH